MLEPCQRDVRKQNPKSSLFFIWDRRSARSLATKSRQSTVWLRFRSILVQTFGLYRFNRRPRDLFYHDRVRLWLLRMNNEYIMIFGTIELYIFRLFSSVFERSMDRRIISISDDPKVTWWSVTVLSTRDQTTDVTIQFFFVYYWLWGTTTTLLSFQFRIIGHYPSRTEIS